MGTEYDYEKECNDIDDFNREEAMKRKAAIANKLHARTIKDANLENKEPHIFVDDVNPMEDTFEDNEPTFHGTYFSNDSHIINKASLDVEE